MKHIDIIVATRNRWKKLLKMLESIPPLDHVNVMVACDNDPDTYDALGQCYKESYLRRVLIARTIIGSEVSTPSGSVKCRNFLAKDVNDGLLYVTDDIVFEPGSIEAAFECFNQSFPDDGGVVGFIQNNEFHPTGIALLGQKFLQRYPDKQLFCPQYFHFACQEIYNLCNKIGGKFVQCPNAKIFHNHPCYYRDAMDQTHVDARIHKDEDMQLISRRGAAGLIWGYNG